MAGFDRNDKTDESCVFRQWLVSAVATLYRGAKLQAPTEADKDWVDEMLESVLEEAAAITGLRGQREAEDE